jgi:hypothetical protein
MALLVIAAALVALRAVLPVALQRYVNQKLDEIPDYGGEIGDVDLSLYRGAYEIENVRIVKTDGDVPVPFFEADKVDFSIQWSELVHGALVGEVKLFSPRLNFVSGPDESQQQKGMDASWQDKVKELFPFRINRLVTYDGEVHYRDFHSDPKVDIYVSDIQLEGRNITNAERSEEALFADFQARGKAMEKAEVRARLRTNALADKPTFTFAGELEALPLKNLNDFLRAYANVDAEAGTFALYAELEAKDGQIGGYAKPFLRDAKVLDWKKDVQEKNPFQAIWEGIVGLGSEVLESDVDAVASRIPISGEVDQANPDILASIGSLLRNAFIEALRPALSGA